MSQIRKLSVLAVLVLAVAAAGAGAANAGKGGGGSAPPPPVAGVTIVSPYYAGATTMYAPFVVTTRVVDSTTSTAPVCWANWGDGSWDAYPASLASAGVYYCGLVHAYTARGTFTVTVSATDSAGAVGSSSVLAFVG